MCHLVYFLSDFFSLTKKIVNYFRVVYTGGNKQYFVERITNSSRLVNNIKVTSMHKRHLKVYARPVFVMFWNIVFKIYDVKTVFFVSKCLFPIEISTSTEDQARILNTPKPDFFFKYHIRQWENIVSFESKGRLWIWCMLLQLSITPVLYWRVRAKNTIQGWLCFGQQISIITRFKTS